MDQLKLALVDAKNALKRSAREADGGKHELKALQSQLKQLAKGKVGELSSQLVEMHGADQRLQVWGFESLFGWLSRTGSFSDIELRDLAVLCVMNCNLGCL